ncbi:MAG: MFS transporter [Verrucomicrobiota bacterium]
MNTEKKPNPSMANETLWQQMRALPREVWILFWGMFINRFGTFVIPFLTLYLKDLGFSSWQIAAVFAAAAVGGVGSMLAGGRLADMIGRKNTISIALIGGAIAMLLMWRADSVWSFVLTAFIHGVAHGMYHPAASSLMADIVPSDRRVTAFAILRWAVNLGFAGGMIAGGVLADKNYDYLFIGDAVTSSIYGVIAFFFLPHGLKTSRQASRWAPALKSMLGNPLFIRYFFANFFVVICFMQWGSSVARLTVDLGYSTKVYGWLMGFNGLVITLFEVPITQFLRKRNPQRVIALGFLLCGVGVWMNWLSFSWLLIAVAMLVFTIGEMIALPISSAYLADLSPEKMRGRYSAALGLTWNLGHAIAPGVGLMLYEKLPIALWWGCLGLGILAMLLMARVVPLRVESSPAKT